MLSAFCVLHCQNRYPRPTFLAVVHHYRLPPNATHLHITPCTDTLLSSKLNIAPLFQCSVQVMLTFPARGWARAFAVLRGCAWRALSPLSERQPRGAAFPLSPWATRGGRCERRGRAQGEGRMAASFRASTADPCIAEREGQEPRGRPPFNLPRAICHLTAPYCDLGYGRVLAGRKMDGTIMVA